MSNPTRVMLLVLLATATWGITAFWEPDGGPPEVDDAPVLGALYAAPVERVETHVLGRGETLDRVLGRAEIVGREMADLLLTLREYTNPRRLRAGSEVTVRRWLSDGSPRAVELRLNADSTVRLDRESLGWSGRVMVTPTTVDTVFVAGEIENGRTLYEAVVYDDKLDLPPAERAALVVELAEIYAFKLDFTHDIQPGDRYRLVYEREARPDGTARKRRVLIAEMVNQGRDYGAVYFEAGGDRGEYFDPEGRSLQTMFRRYPLDYVRITSSFAWRRYHPILGRYRSHLGTDFGAAPGTPVKATGAGVVSFAGWDGGYGNLVKIRHPNGYETRYAHLRGFARGIAAGKRVDQGDVIGYVGATGLATGPHLHYELRQNGQALDPRRMRLPTKPGVPEERLPEFKELLEQRVALLETYAPTPAGPRLARAVDETERTPSGEN